MAKNRPQRPGSPPPVPAPGGGGGGHKSNKPNKPNRPKPKPNNKGKSPPPPPTEDDGPAPLNTDQGRIDASNDPQGYFNYLNSAAGFTPGGGGLFGQWLASDAYDTFNQNFNNARLGGNMDLNVVDYATMLGAPADVANYRAGTLQPLGQAGAASFGAGAPVDTGNPYTSSSGIGAPVTKLPLPGETIGGPRPNKNKNPNQFKRWKKAQVPGVPGASPPPAPLPGATANLGGYADNLRKQFLSLSPQQRGEDNSMWETPGRWSPWG